MESERCLEAPRRAAAQAATSHTVPPTLRCLTCLSVPARALTTSAAPRETPRNPTAVLLEEAAHKPKVFLQGVTPSSLLSRQAGFRIRLAGLPPHLSASPIAQASSRHSPTTAFSAPARSSLTLKGLTTVLERWI